ncbi:MAG TPA: class I SAM-dependent methyltransferase [Parasulfuritortus sp.]
MREEDTRSEAYLRQLLRNDAVFWKRALHVQAPYLWNIRRFQLGRTLDIGCGIGRNLRELGAGSVGVDHNSLAVEVCRQRGLEAYSPQDFAQKYDPSNDKFDALLFSHVLEHMSLMDGSALVGRFIPYLKRRSKYYSLHRRGPDSNATLHTSNSWISQSWRG